MRYEVDIEYPADRMAANRKRWVAWKKYELNLHCPADALGCDSYGGLHLELISLIV